ncbi:MAG: ATP-dependent zinc protease [Myxococcota bacterium]
MTPPDRSSHRERELIGFAERVDLPDWGIRRIRAKVDTGARSSALHVDGIERLPGGKVRFDVVVNRKTGRTKHIVTQLVRVGQVRSSSGKAETRYFVSTRVQIGGVIKRIEISLARRHAMLFRMLLGRTALGHDFLIDPGRRYVTDARPHPKRKSKTRKGGSRDHERKSEGRST